MKPLRQQQQQQPLLQWSLLLLLLCCITAAAPSASAQPPTFYCNRSGQPTRIANPLPEDFYLATSYADSSGQVSANMRCQFWLDSSPSVNNGSSLLYLELDQNPRILWGGPGLTVRETGQSLPHGSKVLAASRYDNEYYQVPAEQTVLTTRPGAQLTVDFVTTGSVAPGQAPILVRVRRFVNCPPGWASVSGYCFSPEPGSGRRLGFAAAQAACNAMRSNLLMLSFPSGGGRVLSNYSSIESFCRNVLHYKQSAWVGMVGKRGRHHGTYLVGLDGSYFELNGEPDSFRCASSLGIATKRCRDHERCVYASLPSAQSPAAYAGLVLDQCDWYVSHPFACYAPYNGTDKFYPVPSSGSGALIAWLLPTLVVCLVGSAIVWLLMFSRCRRRRLRLLGAAALDRQPIVVPPPPPPFGYDPSGQPSAVAAGWHGQVQHPPPPPPMSQQKQQQGGGYDTFSAGGSQLPPAYSPEMQQQHDKK